MLIEKFFSSVNVYSFRFLIMGNVVYDFSILFCPHPIVHMDSTQNADLGIFLGGVDSTLHSNPLHYFKNLYYLSNCLYLIYYTYI